MKLHLHIDKENLIYLILWLMLFLAPVASLYVHTNLANDAGAIHFNWTAILHVWKVYLVYLIIFLVHNFILAPLLIHKHQKLLYIGTTTCLIIVFITYQCMHLPSDRGNRGGAPQEMTGNPGGPDKQQDRMGNLRDYGGPHDMMQDGKGNTPPEAQRQMQADRKDFGKPDRQMRHDDPHMPPLFFGQVDIIAAIVAFLMIGMNLGIKLYFKNDSDDKRMQVLERQNLKQQLEYLKYQINPHFFMNTLNNIHALVDIDPEKAKATIVELSKMMRYLLYEGNNSLIPLQREIQFLHNYITLMRLRYTDKVTIKTDVPEQIPEKQIPPLLLITFIENAFKHGVSYQQDSYINVGILFSDDRLHFECTNSKHPQKQSEQGGVGLTNVKRRLALIYGSDYTLDINDGDDVYEVKLDIPLNRPV
jgi:predicted transcriptional regulator with HTH domain